MEVGRGVGMEVGREGENSRPTGRGGGEWGGLSRPTVSRTVHCADPWPVCGS